MATQWCGKCGADFVFECPLHPKQENIVANVFSNGKHTRLSITVADLEELIMRCGWTVVHDLEIDPRNALAVRAEIARLQGQDSIGSNGSGLDWWNARKISEVPALTPDM